jgi:hypothetical protein
VTQQVRHILMRGAGYLAARQALGLLISSAGMLLLARFIGPANYGIYVSAMAIYSMLVGFTQLGLSNRFSCPRRGNWIEVRSGMRSRCRRAFLSPGC